MAGVGEEIADSDGPWADFPDEDPAEGAALDRELARRADLLEQRTTHGDWCQCGGCWPVQHAFSAFDVTCCHESEPATGVRNENQLFEDERLYWCITHHPSFYIICRYERELMVATTHYRMEGVNVRALQRHEKLRYTAYRKYTEWVHGVLGRSQRREIPHCVMKAIRQRFPEPQGRRHTGFQPPPDENN